MFKEMFTESAWGATVALNVDAIQRNNKKNKKNKYIKFKHIKLSEWFNLSKYMNIESTRYIGGFYELIDGSKTVIAMYDEEAGIMEVHSDIFDKEDVERGISGKY